MIPQSNLVCKAHLAIRRNSDDEIMPEKIPAGRLRAVTIQNFGGGGTNNRNVFFRVEGSDICTDEYSADFGGYSGWVPIVANSNPRDRGTLIVFLDSADSSIDVMWRASVNGDNHACQLGFWYEPDEDVPFYVSPRDPVPALDRG